MPRRTSVSADRLVPGALLALGHVVEVESRGDRLGHPDERDRRPSRPSAYVSSSASCFGEHERRRLSTAEPVRAADARRRRSASELVGRLVRQLPDELRPQSSRTRPTSSARRRGCAALPVDLHGRDLAAPRSGSVPSGRPAERPRSRSVCRSRRRPSCGPFGAEPKSTVGRVSATAEATLDDDERREARDARARAGAEPRRARDDDVAPVAVVVRSLASARKLRTQRARRRLRSSRHLLRSSSASSSARAWERVAATVPSLTSQIAAMSA